jgi:hypothetical protein
MRRSWQIYWSAVRIWVSTPVSIGHNVGAGSTMNLDDEYGPGLFF